MLNKYGFDRFNDWFFAGGSRNVGSFLSSAGDTTLIDGVFVNGSAKVVAWFAGTVRHVQTGMLYHYAFAMILGLAFLLGTFVLYGSKVI
jgi:NADH-quinone oxidoreductase subunit L